MGCFPAKTPKEIIIEEKEKNLKIHDYSITEIRNAFFILSFREEISFENIIKGCKLLKIEFNDSTKTSVLLPFLKGFAKPTILAQDENDYNFRELMAIFFLMSNSSEKEKADGLLQIFDFGHDGQISDKDVLYIIQKLLVCVNTYSNEFIKKNEELKNHFKEMEKNFKLDKKLDVVADKCKNELLLRGNQKWDEQTFYPMMINFKEKFGYDFLSIKGLRKIASDVEDIPPLK